MGNRADYCAYLWVSLAALSFGSSACDYDNGGFSGATPIDVVRDAAPASRDTRGSGATPSTDASSGLGATSVNPPDAGASPPEAGSAPAADAGVMVDGATSPPDAPAPPPAGPPAACASAAALPVSFRRLGQGPRSDDFSFDRNGHLIAFDGMDFVRVPRLGSVEVLARDAIGNRGGALRMVASGDAYLADYQRDQVLVVAAGAAPRRLAGTVNSPMKMVAGPGGALYVSGQQGNVYRIDPATGAVATAATTGFRVGGLGFTSDYRSLIVAGLDQGLQALDLRPDGTLAPARAFADVRNAEALAADACGNLYAVVENDSRVRRISATGKVDVLVDLRGVYAWSLAFGSGQQGWSATALYVMEATGPMYELGVAVPGQGPPLVAAD
jgi:hypothetical protein